MIGRSNTAVLVSIGAGALAVLAFTAGELDDDAILRALATGFLVLCLSTAVRAARQRRAPKFPGSGSGRA